MEGSRGLPVEAHGGHNVTLRDIDFSIARFVKLVDERACPSGAMDVEDSSLPNVDDWRAYETARQKLMPNLSLSVPAIRYQVAKGAAA